MQIKPLIPLIAMVLLCSCKQPKHSASIYYVNSYHDGYASSDSILAGMQRVLASENVEMKSFFMDTKRKNDLNFIHHQTQKALSEIREYNPDIIIASDDNAVKFLIEPHFKNTEVPVLFCGVNWSARQYGLPTANITGMVEVMPLNELFQKIRRQYPDACILTVLSENTTSEKNNRELLDTLYQNTGFNTIRYSLVDNFSDWKKAFLHANDASDIIYVPTNGAIRNWNEQEAVAFISEHIKKPVVTCDDFMMRYAVFGLTKVASEQGEWVAGKALEIINGKDIRKIQMVRNTKYTCWFNRTFSDIIGFQPDVVGIENCNEMN